MTGSDEDSGIYVGIEFKFDRANKRVTLLMRKYISALLESYNVNNKAETPCASNLMSEEESPSVDPKA